ncbi:ABC transporter ATP-binding protein [Streptomyces physcomitrii]|uniref:ABC transporter ATP-binding protein n=1 Tax=Streptomyces physcomitrii TaxID=2724184 RepID=A0ABX1H690_9ACTN|nr:ABC transporter ATP-binding protein [Streptomyces physcomitrii]NKI43881.1 ABC transporter ATP-binding protein [Streptomyces physcomitrii]
MAPDEYAITAEGLTKDFGKFRALDGLDLSVRTGEVHGFLGPNGAGKSTTIRALLGLLKPTAGKATLLGKDPWADAVEVHHKLAYVPGDVSLWRNLSGGEAIDLFGTLRGGIDKSRKAELIERFQLDPTKKCRAYSKGNRQKVALVSAFASDSELLILDEPTSGLDPLMEAVFQSCVKEVKAQGRTVLLSSHILAEVEALCDRVSIVRRGRTVESGSLQELRHLTRTSLSVETQRPATGLAELPGVHNAVAEGNHLKLDVDNAQLEPVLAKVLGFGVVSLNSAPPTLEELFMRHYGDAPAEDGADGDGGKGGADRAKAEAATR